MALGSIEARLGFDASRARRDHFCREEGQETGVERYWVVERRRDGERQRESTVVRRSRAEYNFFFFFLYNKSRVE